MRKYLYNWSLVRLLRLAVGIAIIVQGILVRDGLFITLGVLFSLMPLLNAGCGPGGSCTTGRTSGRTNVARRYGPNAENQ